MKASDNSDNSGENNFRHTWYHKNQTENETQDGSRLPVEMLLGFVTESDR